MNSDQEINLTAHPSANGERAKPSRFEMRWPPREPLPEELRRRICCIVPCYNVGKLCEPVLIESARHAGRIVAVDDGSTDDTPQFLKKAKEQTSGVIDVLTLPQNRGKGVALLRGFRHALRQTDCDVIVTLDGDGQHRPGDIPMIAEPCLSNEADLTIAQRQFPPSVPARSRIGNNLSRAILMSAYRKCPPDTQCGLRSHRRELVEEMLEIVEGNRYDTEARILMLCLRLKRRVAQRPIPAIYLGKNESSHYRPFTDSLRILLAFFTIVALPELGIPTTWEQMLDFGGPTSSSGRGQRRTRTSALQHSETSLP